MERWTQLGLPTCGRNQAKNLACILLAVSIFHIPLTSYPLYYSFPLFFLPPSQLHGRDLLTVLEILVGSFLNQFFPYKDAVSTLSCPSIFVCIFPSALVLLSIFFFLWSYLFFFLSFFDVINIAQNRAKFIENITQMCKEAEQESVDSMSSALPSSFFPPLPSPPYFLSFFLCRSSAPTRSLSISYNLLQSTIKISYKQW